MEGIKDSLSLFGDIESFVFLCFMLFAKKSLKLFGFSFKFVIFAMYY